MAHCKGTSGDPINTGTFEVPETRKLLEPMIPLMLHKGICYDLHDFGSVSYTSFVIRKLWIGGKFGLFEDPFRK